MNSEAMEVQEASPKYGFTAAKPAVPAGYKQTEVGVIPEDWEVTSLGSCLTVKPSYGINAPAVPYSDKLPAYIRITDITEEGQFAPNPGVSVRADSFESYYLEEGDIVFARTGASVGKSYLYRVSDGPLVYAGFLIRARPNRHQLLPAFLAAYATTGRYWQWVKLMSMRSGQPGINGNEYAKLPIPCPPLGEQRAIATALSDVDALLEELDRLIAKKRDIKQAAMQQLLTGQTRLPGFKVKWEVKCLGDVLERLSNGAVYKPIYQGGVHITRIETIADGHIDIGRTGIAAWENSLSKHELRTDDILFSHINSVDHIGKVAIVTDDHHPIYHGMNLLLMRTNNSCCSRYLFYWLASEATRKKMRNLAKQAVSQASINTSELRAVEASIPSRREQEAISCILSDLEAEIKTLEKRYAKTTAIKQAMMQELLTGRIRLLTQGECNE